MENEAYVYCIRLSPDLVKIGSHLGSLKKLDARYGTYCEANALRDKLAFRIEPNLRVHVERTIQGLITRIQDVKKEKFKREAERHFEMLMPFFALTKKVIKTNGETQTDPIDNDADKENDETSAANDEGSEETKRVMQRLKEIQHEKRLQKIAQYEAKQRAEAEAEMRQRAEVEAALAVEREHDKDTFLPYRQRYIVPDANGFIPWSLLRNHFREWHIENIFKQGGKAMTLRGDEIREYFISKLGQMTQSTVKDIGRPRGFHGYRCVF